MADPRELRVSDADREAAAGRLHTALGEGRITLVELEERIGVVYAARTYADLEPPLADLPDAGVVSPVAAAPATSAERVELRTEMGSITRRGDWTVPSSLLLTTRMGSIDLDLSAARSVPPRIDVEVRVGMGDVTIVLPESGSADVDGVRASWGEVSTKVPGTPGVNGPHLRITGRLGMGSLKVRGPRLGWRALLG